MICNYEQYTLNIDTESTSIANGNIPLVSQSCSCQGCQNYSVATDTLPIEVLSFFNSFGIDVKRPSEVFGSYDNGIFHYGGFYHVVGTIISQKEELFKKINEKESYLNPNMVIQITDKFSVWFTLDCSLVPEGFPTPHFQIEIDAFIPWSFPEQYCDDLVPATAKIVDGAIIIEKNKEKYFLKRYYFVFRINNKYKKLFVSEKQYEDYQVGWTGMIGFNGSKIKYISKRSVSMN